MTSSGWQTTELIHPDLVDELFAAADDDEGRELIALFWKQLHEDLPEEFELLERLLPEAGGPTWKMDVHRISGVCASAGLCRCAGILRQIEPGNLPMEELRVSLAAARDAAIAGLAAIGERYPTVNASL